ncbi:L-rhamnose mutarotase [Pseudomonas entomophila]|uniref:L-rhamnose mutarotase n=1 Tax=Pseudomonas entomophila TaxID=312306 RepID=UPI002406B3CA|nr:L-rhamnose mutarotase [Pseudomonas entomophila]MDF9618639.1 L-rhamnose mutarotase [Pseudomonas entomophila]
MKRIGFSIELTSLEAAELYKAMHRDVPVQISGERGVLREIGLQRMSIYLLPPRTLFMQVEAHDQFDPLRDFTHALSVHPVIQAWDDRMHGDDNPLLKRIEGNRTDLNWWRLEQVYDWTLETAGQQK